MSPNKTRFYVDFDGPVLPKWCDTIEEARAYAETYVAARPIIYAHVPILRVHGHGVMDNLLRPS